MRILKNILLATIISIGLHVWAQQTPATAQQETIILSGATIHIGNGTVIESGYLIFENGKITEVGQGATRKQGKMIEVIGKHIYPGFIAPVSSLGLGEIDAVRATNDDDEIGDFIPHIRSLIAYNSESKVVESMRPNGVLLAQITPQGGSISGTSSIVQLDAWNWEDAAVKVDDGIHVHWPNTYRRGRWWMGEERGWKPNKEYEKDSDAFKMYVAHAKAYSKTSSVSKNEGFEAMQGLFNGTKKLYLYAQGEKEIIDGVTACKEAGIENIVLVGGYEAYKIIPFLKQNNISVIVNRVHSTPDRDDDDYDLPYKLPKLLTDGGLMVSLNAVGQMERMNTRNLPFYAGQVAGQGMDKEEALKLITSNTAKVLGIDANYGTLEAGKSATLFISEGDALDMRTNIVTHAFIDGRHVSLETHQTELWKRYAGKFGQN
ncbi:MAG: amidohydrolase family protein [Flavobacteriaceae bacterium]|nr:amidohydrolase family protein [Flavobacteriaceae bacterium]